MNINISGLIPSSTQAAVPAFREGLRKEVDLVVTFSLDGVGRIHDQIRGVKHGFEQTMASIQWCREFAAQTAGLRLLLNCTVSRNNYGDCRRVLDLAEELGIRVSLTYAAANGLFLSNLAMTDGFKVKDDAAIAVAEQFTDAANDDRLPLTERHYYTLAAEMAVGGSRNVPCVFQDRGIFLDIDGTVYPCGTAPDLPYARLPDEPFGPAYYGAHGDAVRAALRARYCSQCPSNSYHGLASGVWLEVLKMRRGRS